MFLFKSPFQRLIIILLVILAIISDVSVHATLYKDDLPDCLTTGDICVRDCHGIDNGDYQSCDSCSVFTTCSNGGTHARRNCANGGLFWDDKKKICDYHSTTCHCTVFCGVSAYCGKVVISGTTMGIHGVAVYDTLTNITLGTTNTIGDFSVLVSGSPSHISMRKPGYYNPNNVIDVAHNMHINMFAITTPVFTKEPIDAQALLGQMVVLKCEATSYPNPHTFHWFKDDDSTPIMTFNNPYGHNLELQESTSDTSTYYCVAMSEYSNIASQKAVVSFKEVNEDCEYVKENLVRLPAGCKMANSHKNYVDKGFCGTIRPCIPESGTSSQGNNGQDLTCCMPTQTANLVAHCDNGQSMYVQKIMACGCINCLTDNHFKVTGTISIIGSSADISPFDEVWVYYKGQPITWLSGNTFEFQAQSSAKNIVYEIKSKTFMPTVRTVSTFYPIITFDPITLTKFKTLRTYVQLVKKPDGEVFNSYVGKVVNVKSLTGKPSAIEICVDKNSFVDSQGKRYNGNVKLITHLADSRDGINGLDSSPGAFRALSVRGDYSVLRTSGTLTVLAESGTGEKLTFIKPYVMNLNVKELRLDTDGDDDVDADIYTMDTTIGSWHHLDKLDKTLVKKRRRKRAVTTIPYKVLKSDMTYFNLNKPHSCKTDDDDDYTGVLSSLNSIVTKGIKEVWEVCYVAVDLMHNFTDHSGQHACMDKPVKAITMDQNFSMLKADVYTNYKGRGCMTVLCDKDTLTSVTQTVELLDYTPTYGSLLYTDGTQSLQKDPPSIRVKTKVDVNLGVSSTMDECMYSTISYNFVHPDLPT